MTCCHFLPTNEVTFSVHRAKGCNPWLRKIKAAVTKTVAAADGAKTQVYLACAKISVKHLGKWVRCRGVRCCKPELCKKQKTSVNLQRRCRWLAYNKNPGVPVGR